METFWIIIISCAVVLAFIGIVRKLTKSTTATSQTFTDKDSTIIIEEETFGNVVGFSNRPIMSGTVAIDNSQPVDIDPVTVEEVVEDMLEDDCCCHGRVNCCSDDQEDGFIDEPEPEFFEELDQEDVYAHEEEEQRRYVHEPDDYYTHEANPEPEPSYSSTQEELYEPKRVYAHESESSYSSSDSYDFSSDSDWSSDGDSDSDYD